MILSLHLEKSWLNIQSDSGLIGSGEWEWQSKILACWESYFGGAEAYFLPTAVTWYVLTIIKDFLYTRDYFSLWGNIHLWEGVQKTLLWHFYQFNGKGQPTNFIIIEHILDNIKPWFYICTFINTFYFIYSISNICSQETLLQKWYLNGDQVLEVTRPLNVGEKDFPSWGNSRSKASKLLIPVYLGEYND